MNDTNELPQEPVAQPAPSPQPPPPPGLDLKRRMRELLSIPDSQRSDEQWDELIEIEIQLAPGNRVGAVGPRQNEPRAQGPRGGGGGGGGGGGNWKRHGSGGGGGGGGGAPGGGGGGGRGKHPRSGPKKPPQAGPASA